MTRTPSIRQNEGQVRQLFEDQLRLYTESANVVESPILPFLTEWMGDRPILLDRPMRLLECGGGGGGLLAAIQDAAGARMELFNLELVDRFRPFQVLPEIRFVPGSVLRVPFGDDSFDMVLARNLLHHLVSDSIRGTRANQRQAVSELFRVARPGGLLLIDEQINRSKASCALLFLLSTWASRIGLRIRSLMVTPHTVVGYLTDAELEGLCDSARAGSERIARTYRRWTLGFRWRMTFLLRDTGTAFLAYQKHPGKAREREDSPWT